MSRFKSGEFAWADVREAVFNGFHASLAAYADAGNDLILEHILDTNEWMTALRKLLSSHNVFFVAVHCRLDVLIEREKLRGDRRLGSAKRDFETIHVGKLYDLELDGEDGAEANVERLLIAWRSTERASSFDN